MNSFLVLCIIAAVYFSTVNGDSSECQATGLDVGLDILKEQNSIWWVGRKLVHQFPEVFDVPNCTPPTLTAFCSGIKVQINANEDGSKSLKIAAYDGQYENVACSELSYPLVGDKKRLVFSGDVVKYGTIGTDNKLENLPNIPDEYKPTRGKVAIIAIAENKEWIALQTCDKQIAWVLYSDSVVQAQTQDNFNSAVESAMTSAGQDYTKLVPVYITLITRDTTPCFT